MLRINGDSIGCKAEILFGLMLSSLFILQSSQSHGRKQPTRHEKGLKGRKLGLPEPAVQTVVKLGSLHTHSQGCML